MTDFDPRSLECLMVENWQHARHVENERLSFTQFYATIVGVVVAILVEWSDLRNVLVLPLTAFLLVLSVLGLLLAQKWGKTFDEHVILGGEAAVKLRVGYYMISLKSYKGLARFFRTQYLFCYFYAAVIGSCIGVICYNLSSNLDLSIVFGAVFFFVSISECINREIKRY